MADVAGDAPFGRIDVSSWPVRDAEPGGTDSTVWLLAGSDDTCSFKPVTDHGSGVVQGEDRAEKAASHLAGPMSDPRPGTAAEMSCTFLIHGTRHIATNEPELDGRVHRVSAGDVERVLRSARGGDPLELRPEPENPKNSEAMVALAAGTPLGYVPDLLVHDLHRLMRRAPVSASIVRVNAPDAPPHLRVLAELRASGVEGFRFFQDARWQPLA